MPGRGQKGGFNQRGDQGAGGGRGRRNAGMGPSGNCVCPSCGNKIPHQRGLPCYEMSCPRCGTAMTREGLQSRPQNNPGQTNHKNTEGKVPSIDQDKCVGCGDCIEACPFAAIEIKNGKAQLLADKCRGCRQCIPACPTEAISAD